MKKRFSYVYILQSEVDPERFYVGLARDLRDRLKRHNAGQILHTTKWIPWRIKPYIAFRQRPGPKLRKVPEILFQPCFSQKAFMNNPLASTFSLANFGN